MKQVPLVLALFCAVFLTACQDELYSGLSQRAANEMIAVLSENGIKASRVAGDTSNTYKVRVASDDMAQAARILQATGFPKDTYRSMGDIFPGDGIIVTPFEQRARMSYAISQELSKTISEIEGIVTARVHVMLPEGDTRSAARAQSPNASVVVQHAGQIDANEMSQRIRLIVSNAVTNLSPRNVAVSIFPARGSMGGNGIGASSMGDAGQMAAGSKPAGLFEIKSPFGFTLWILAALALLAGFLVYSHSRKQAR